MRRFDLALPRTVNDCLKILATPNGDTKLVAGGTDLLPQLKNGLLKPVRVVDLSRVTALRTVRKATGGGLRIGAAVTARALELDQRVRSAYPSLAEGAALVGSVQIRNLATWAATSATPRRRRTWRRRCSRSRPTPSSRGRAVGARVPLAEFFLGVRRTVLGARRAAGRDRGAAAPGRGSGGNYLRHTPRRELDIAVVGVASQVTS